MLNQKQRIDARIKIVQNKLRKFPLEIKINIRDGGTYHEKTT